VRSDYGEGVEWGGIGRVGVEQLQIMNNNNNNNNRVATRTKVIGPLIIYRD